MRFPAYPNLRKEIRQYPLAAAQDFIEGAVVLITAGEVSEAAADPLVILGVALHDAGALPDEDKVLVAIGLEGATFVMQGSAAPLPSDEGKEYGITKDADGVWHVDKAKTGAAARVVVEKVYIDGNMRDVYEVRFLAANRQIAG